MIMLLRALFDPRLASTLGALLAGEPDFAEALICIARRESRFELVGLHEGDAWMQRTLGPGMSTRGVHGQVAAFSLPGWLHGAPWLLDVPLVSAVLATRRAKHWRCRAVAACVRWKECER